jgi:hypothetical protein
MANGFSKLKTVKATNESGFIDPLKPLLEGPHPRLWPTFGAGSEKCKNQDVVLPWCWFRLLPDKDYKEPFFPYNRLIYEIYRQNRDDWDKEVCTLIHYLPARGPKPGWIIFFPCGCEQAKGSTKAPTEEGICDEDLAHLGHLNPNEKTCSGGVYDPVSKTFFKVPAKNMLLFPNKKRKRRTGGTRTSLTDKKHYSRGRPSRKPERQPLLNDLH